MPRTTGQSGKLPVGVLIPITVFFLLSLVPLGQATYLATKVIPSSGKHSELPLLYGLVAVESVISLCLWILIYGLLKKSTLALKVLTKLTYAIGSLAFIVALVNSIGPGTDWSSRLRAAAIVAGAILLVSLAEAENLKLWCGVEPQASPSESGDESDLNSPTQDKSVLPQTEDG